MTNASALRRRCVVSHMCQHTASTLNATIAIRNGDAWIPRSQFLMQKNVQGALRRSMEVMFGVSPLGMPLYVAILSSFPAIASMLAWIQIGQKDGGESPSEEKQKEKVNSIRLSRARIELATFGYLLALSKITVDFHNGAMRPTS